ncbi:MAG: hypothetical protein LBH29_02945, partial [Elusimicrobiota bacterium]|nr:hypothetical protein [Elusimicrobiota bacterium]
MVKNQVLYWSGIRHYYFIFVCFYEKGKISMPVFFLNVLTISPNQIYSGQSFGLKIDGKTIEAADKNAYLTFNLGNDKKEKYKYASIFISEIKAPLSIGIIPKTEKRSGFDNKNLKALKLSKGKNSVMIDNGIWTETMLVFPNAKGARLKIDKIMMTEHYPASAHKAPLFIFLWRRFYTKIPSLPYSNPFIRLKKLNSFFETLSASFLNKDIVELIYNRWREIPPLYKKSFLVVFIALNLVFLFDTVNFMFHNHDWNSMTVGTATTGWNIKQGRYSPRFISAILQRNEILPIGINVASFMGFSLAAVLLCIYWKVPKNLFSYSLIGLLMALQPYIIAEMFFKLELLSRNMWSPFLIILACIISGKASNCGIADKENLAKHNGGNSAASAPHLIKNFLKNMHILRARLSLHPYPRLKI